MQLDPESERLWNDLKLTEINKHLRMTEHLLLIYELGGERTIFIDPKTSRMMYGRKAYEFLLKKKRLLLEERRKFLDI